MKTLCSLLSLAVVFLSVCLWQEYHADMLFRKANAVDMNPTVTPIKDYTIVKGTGTCSESYPVYINRDTPETTVELALCREKLKKMEIPE